MLKNFKKIDAKHTGLFAAGVLQTKTKIVYHIPFAGEDQMMIRKIVEQEMRAGRQENALFFMEEGQTCLI